MIKFSTHKEFTNRACIPVYCKQWRNRFCCWKINPPRVFLMEMMSAWSKIQDSFNLKCSIWRTACKTFKKRKANKRVHFKSFLCVVHHCLCLGRCKLIVCFEAQPPLGYFCCACQAYRSWYSFQFIITKLAALSLEIFRKFSNNGPS